MNPRRLTRAILAFIAVALCALPSSAATGDFFCSPLPIGKTLPTPVYFETHAKGCDGVVETKGVCVQSVLCTHVPPTKKNDIVAKYVESMRASGNKVDLPVAFEKVPEPFVNTALREHEWLESMVVCETKVVAKHAEPGAATPICPMPNTCKGDLFFGASAAIPDIAGALDTMYAGKTRFYEHKIRTKAKELK